MNASTKSDPRAYLSAGRRLAVRSSDCLENWYVSHSPRNDNYNAEGTWEEWVELAHLILNADAAHKQQTT